MRLRHKFGVLALIYVVSLSANLVMSAWCILVYFQSAFGEYEAAILAQDQIEHVRSLFNRQLELCQGNGSPDELKAGSKLTRQEMATVLASIADDPSSDSPNDLWQRIQQSAAQAEEAVARRCSTGEALSKAERAAFRELDVLLGSASAAFSLRRQTSVARATGTQQQIKAILLVNTACGAALCVLGLVVVRRWVLHPVAELREATKQVSQGNFGYRIKPRSQDELGRLADEVNQMAATIVDMQAKLVEKERLAAAGEMITRLAHNIRNPLAGIRGLAEATIQGRDSDDDVCPHQQRIIETVDRFESWLRGLQHSVSPMDLNLQRISIGDLVANVVRALRPMAERRRVVIEVSVAPEVDQVEVDSLHFEQALVALITNAVQASRESQVVRVAVDLVPETAGRWQLTVEDQGAGIPPDLQDKIFTPYFTTKPDGGGVGLATASKVVNTHGGELTLESEPDQGSRFTAVMPGLVTEH